MALCNSELLLALRAPMGLYLLLRVQDTLQHLLPHLPCLRRALLATPSVQEKVAEQQTMLEELNENTHSQWETLRGELNKEGIKLVSAG